MIPIKGPDIKIKKPETNPLKTKPRLEPPTTPPLPPKPPKKAPPGTASWMNRPRVERMEDIAFWIGVAAAVLGVSLYLWAHFSK